MPFVLCLFVFFSPTWDTNRNSFSFGYNSHFTKSLANLTFGLRDQNRNQYILSTILSHNWLTILSVNVFMSLIDINFNCVLFLPSFRQIASIEEMFYGFVLLSSFHPHSFSLYNEQWRRVSLTLLFWFSQVLLSYNMLLSVTKGENFSVIIVYVWYLISTKKWQFQRSL